MPIYVTCDQIWKWHVANMHIYHPLCVWAQNDIQSNIYIHPDMWPSLEMACGQVCHVSLPCDKACNWHVDMPAYLSLWISSEMTRPIYLTGLRNGICSNKTIPLPPAYEQARKRLEGKHTHVTVLPTAGIIGEQHSHPRVMPCWDWTNILSTELHSCSPSSPGLGSFLFISFCDIAAWTQSLMHARHTVYQLSCIPRSS